ncbi:MAG: response regulator [Patescibacteria group bacterium]|nr:response regulator [Patescibacteria group bacterium]
MSKPKILIVEDELSLVEALNRKFSQAGFEILEANDGEIGLKTALKEKPDVVMLDILMPKMDGIEAMKQIRQDKKWGKRVPIIMLTNVNDSTTVSEAANYQVFDFLIKTDWRLDDIVDLVKSKL